jgi:hypothetical protein
MAIKHIILLFVETPRKFITAVINLRGVSKQLVNLQTWKYFFRNLVCGLIDQGSCQLTEANF